MAAQKMIGQSLVLQKSKIFFSKLIEMKKQMIINSSWIQYYELSVRYILEYLSTRDKLNKGDKNLYCRIGWCETTKLGFFTLSSPDFFSSRNNQNVDDINFKMSDNKMFIGYLYFIEIKFRLGNWNSQLKRFRFLY